MTKVTNTLLAAIVIGLSAPVSAGMPAKAASCNGCHAGGNPANPTLCGKPTADMVKAINEYKDGTRNNPMMKAMVSGLSDADAEEVSAWYSAQPCK